MDELKLAINAAVSAGKLVRELRETKYSKSFKESHRDVVTEVDLISEKIIIDTLSSLEPFSYLSEETNELVGNSDDFWAIDPIDGTANFVNGSENYCVSIGKVSKMVMELGVIYAPEKQDLYYSHKDFGAFKNQEKLQISGKNLCDALVAVSLPGAQDKIKAANVFEILNKVNYLSSGVLRLGSAALHLAQHAEGIFGACIGFDAKIWDIAAGIAICRNAGSIVKLTPTTCPYTFDYICGDEASVSALENIVGFKI
jgi:myo-inositol-1(or 4)-monophosphatase